MNAFVNLASTRGLEFLRKVGTARLAIFYVLNQLVLKTKIKNNLSCINHLVGFTHHSERFSSSEFAWYARRFCFNFYSLT